MAQGYLLIVSGRFFRRLWGLKIILLDRFDFHVFITSRDLLYCHGKQQSFRLKR